MSERCAVNIVVRWSEDGKRWVSDSPTRFSSLGLVVSIGQVNLALRAADGGVPWDVITWNRAVCCSLGPECASTGASLLRIVIWCQAQHAHTR